MLSYTASKHKLVLCLRTLCNYAAIPFRRNIYLSRQGRIQMLLAEKSAEVMMRLWQLRALP